MGVFDGETAARLARMGIDLTALLEACGVTAPVPCAAQGLWHPAADVYEADDHVLIKVDLAGVQVEAMTLTVQENLVILRGERRAERPHGLSAVAHLEIEYGPFEKRIWLPWRVRTRGIRYAYRDGFLQIEMPKTRRLATRTACIRVRM